MNKVYVKPTIDIVDAEFNILSGSLSSSGYVDIPYAGNASENGNPGANAKRNILWDEGEE